MVTTTVVAATLSSCQYHDSSRRVRRCVRTGSGSGSGGGRRWFLLLLVHLLVEHADGAAGWIFKRQMVASPMGCWKRPPRRAWPTPLLLLNAKKKVVRSRHSATVHKGFAGAAAGTAAAAAWTTNNIDLDTSPTTQRFYTFLQQHGAGETLQRATLADTPLNDDHGAHIRGVVAWRDLRPGDAIINIPFAAALSLGQERHDPTSPALDFLQHYLAGMNDPTHTYHAYFAMLPTPSDPDCQWCPDFFSDAALAALQAPLLVDETMQRRARVQARFAQAFGHPANMTWIDGTPLMPYHLQWAVWLVTSRVLTVQGGGDNDATSYKLLIPFLDMCNHDRTSVHVLTGLAATNGRLQVVAGRPIKAGSVINICYGDGLTTGNDRFLSDYGFLDPDPRAYRIVAQQLLGQRKAAVVSGGGGGGGGGGMPGGRKLWLERDRQIALAALAATSMADDEALLANSTECADAQVRLAVQYRLGVKRALENERTTT